MGLGILFPGQGSQSIGMLKDLKSSYNIVSEIFEEASDILSCDLWKITKNGPETKINDTEFTQPIMLCAHLQFGKYGMMKAEIAPFI